MYRSLDLLKIYFIHNPENIYKYILKKKKKKGIY